MDIVVFRGGSEQLQQLGYDERTEPTDTAEILAERITLRIAPGVLDGKNGGGSGPPG